MSRYFVDHDEGFDGRCDAVFDTKEQVIDWISNRLGKDTNINNFTVIYGDLMEIKAVDVVKSVTLERIK